MKSIPYAKQSITEADLNAVLGVLKSEFLTQGPAIDHFEKAVADYCGARHAIAVSNATAALHIGCLALGLKAGDALWTSPNTFVASANCARYCGADVDFVDIDPSTCNMSVEELEKKLERASREGRLPKVLVPVHYSGQSCDMDRIGALARKYSIKVIEDASHAIGASYQGKRIGACEHSDLVVFSFHPVKIITTGEGGMLLTNNDELAARLRRLRTHGITRNSAEMAEASHGPWYFEQVELGFNYRLTDMQAALGLSQFSRLEAFLARRRELVKRYDAALVDLPVRVLGRVSGAESAWHLYPVRVDLARARRSHREIFDELKARGVLVQLHYIPVHYHPYYRELGFEKGQFPQSEKFYDEALSLPLYYELSNSEQERVIQTLSDVLGGR